jgi:transcription-repair coupling factor (superfamily II helicase)
METSKVLLDLASSGEAKELVKRIRNGKARQVKADGLCGSSAALFLAGMMSKRGNFPNMMVVMNDLDDAGYMYHDLTQMMGEERVLFFPSSYRRAIKYNQKDAGNEILRTEVLTKVSEAQDLLVVTYPDALAERVVSKKTLEENTLEVKVGGSFDISELEKQIFGM